jgi:hypothetical protein
VESLLGARHWATRVKCGLSHTCLPACQQQDLGLFCGWSGKDGSSRKKPEVVGLVEISIIFMIISPLTIKSIFKFISI